VTAGQECTYSAVGYRFRVLAATGTVDEELHRHLRPFEVAAAAPDEELPLFRLVREDGLIVASLDGRPLGTDPKPALPFLQLLWRISYEAIPAIKDRLAFHAGAVCLDGEGLALPASSGSGKSTLVAALVIAGAAYLSDEVALVAGGMLEPFPRALSLKEGSLALLGNLEGRLPPALGDSNLDQRFVAPDDLRPDALGTACPLRLVVFPCYEPGAPTALEPMSRAAGVVELIGNSFNFPAFGGEGLEALAAAARDARFYRLSSGDLAEAVDAVCSLVGGARALGSQASLAGT
jgi:hypothetical protein